MSHRKRKGERQYGDTCQNLRAVRNYGLFCGCRNQYCQRSAGFRYYRYGKYGGTGGCGKNSGCAGEFGVSVSVGKSHGQSRHRAGIRKEGACYDLAIAVGILLCGSCAGVRTDAFAFVGELSLDGFLRPVRGVLPMMQEAARRGIANCIVPLENADEAALTDACRIYPAASLPEVLQILTSKRTAWPIPEEPAPSRSGCGDYREAKGPGHAVRAAEIAAAGGHNVLFIGRAGLREKHDCRQTSRDSAEPYQRRGSGDCAGIQRARHTSEGEPPSQ